MKATIIFMLLVVCPSARVSAAACASSWPGRETPSTYSLRLFRVNFTDTFDPEGESYSGSEVYIFTYKSVTNNESRSPSWESFFNCLGALYKKMLCQGTTPNGSWVVICKPSRVFPGKPGMNTNGLDLWKYFTQAFSSLSRDNKDHLSVFYGESDWRYGIGIFGGSQSQRLQQFLLSASHDLGAEGSGNVSEARGKMRGDSNRSTDRTDEEQDENRCEDDILPIMFVCPNSAEERMIAGLYAKFVGVEADLRGGQLAKFEEFENLLELIEETTIKEQNDEDWCELHELEI